MNAAFAATGLSPHTRTHGPLRLSDLPRPRAQRQAITDFGAAWLIPDPASASGLSVRVIGYAPSTEAVLTVSLLPSETDAADPPAGDWWARSRDRSILATAGSTSRAKRRDRHEQGR